MNALSYKITPVANIYRDENVVEAISHVFPGNGIITKSGVTRYDQA